MRIPKQRGARASRALRTASLGGLSLACVLVGVAGHRAWANGGPFVIKHASGDSAAKGVLARLMPNLRPGRESVLKVLREDLTVSFEPKADPGYLPLYPFAHVSAEYTIENPSDRPVTLDFGFPILHGFYVRPAHYDHPAAMFPSPPQASIAVTQNGQRVDYAVISNSMLFGAIRSIAKPAIDRALAAPDLAAAVRAVRKEAEPGPARQALVETLTRRRGFGENEAVLLADYASLDFSPPSAKAGDAAPAQAAQASHRIPDGDFSFMWKTPWERDALAVGNLGPLRYIGEQKATQLMALLAAKLDPKSAVSYESILAAWGGEVRERSVDLAGGSVRPRESKSPSTDSALYARVDFMAPPPSTSLRRRLDSILSHLPVVFTFVPMNLIHAQATFAAKSTARIRFAYEQFAYEDTGTPATFQLAYVVHPASFWDSFGSIHLDVAVPDGVSFRASVPTSRGRPETGKHGESSVHYRGEVPTKTGEIYLGLSAIEWKKASDAILAKRKASEPAR
jgi:hypothetical protein